MHHVIMNGFNGRAGDRIKSKEIADLCVVRVLLDREDREDQETEIQEDL